MTRIFLLLSSTNKVNPSATFERGCVVVLSCLAAIFIALTFLLSTQTAFASEESEKHYQQAETHYSNNNFQKAVEEYTEAIKDEEDNAKYYKDRGWAYYKWKRYFDAEKDFKQAIQLNPNLANAYDGLAYVYKAQEKNDEAKEYFIKAAEKYTDFEPEKLNTILKNLDEAIALGNTLNNNDADIYVTRGWIYYALERYDEALTDFNQAISLNSDDADAYSGRASVYKEQDHIDSARADFLYSGDRYILVENYTEARKEFNNAL